MAPVSQKADRRPISFYLDDGVAGTVTHVPMVIRPEDLTRMEPSLQTVTQTFDGAFLDDFGPGVASIQLAGHTGWNSGAGWQATFDTLRGTVWKQWHASRADAVKRGRHPDEVRLIFADALDSIVNVVAPGQFTLKRNRSRPLLMQYQISLTVLSDRLSADLLDKLKLQPDGTAVSDPLIKGVTSLQSSLDRIEAAADGVQNWIDASIAAPVRNLMNLSTTALTKVLDVVNTTRSIVGAQARQFIGIATDLAQVGRNLFYCYSAVSTLPDFVRHQVSHIAAAFENAFCVLKNAFRPVATYPDYSDVYGASNCSSTIGGSPASAYANVNTFEFVAPGVSLPPSVAADARVALDRAKAVDFVLSPFSVSEIGATASAISNGVQYG